MDNVEHKVEKINKSLEKVRDLANEGLEQVRKGKPITELPDRIYNAGSDLADALRNVKKK